MLVFRWTHKRSRIVGLLARGWPHVAIAERVGVHRNTVRNLLQHHEVRNRLAEKRLAFVSSTNLRRLHQISAMMSRVDRLVHRQLTAFEQYGACDPKALKTFRATSKEKRALARAERKELAAIDEACAFYREVRGSTASAFRAWLSAAANVSNTSPKAPGRLLDASEAAP